MSSNLRSRLAGALAVERPVGPEISMEEEAILLTEAATDLAEANAESEEVKRLEDVADALEDLTIAGDRIQEARPEDLLMVESAARLAVAGSDVETQEVVPALESYLGKKISMEGIADLARKIWDGIVRMVRKIWEKVEAFFYKILGTIPNLRRAVKKLRERIEEAGNKSVHEPKTSLGSEVNALRRADVAPKTGADIIASLGVVSAHNKYFLENDQSKVADVFNAAAEGMNDFDAEKGEESLRGLVTKITGAVGKGAGAPAELKVRNASDARFAKDEYTTYEPLPGNVSVFVRNGTVSMAGDTSVLGLAEGLRRCYGEIRSTNAKAKDPLTEAVITTLALGEMSAVCDKIDEICDQIEDHRRGKQVKDIDKARQTLKTATDKLTKEMDGKNLTTNALPYYRSAVKFNSWLTRTATQPSTGLVAHGLTACRAAMVACSKSLSQYR